jgi:hypothetical protein
MSLVHAAHVTGARCKNLFVIIKNSPYIPECNGDATDCPWLGLCVEMSAVSGIWEMLTRLRLSGGSRSELDVSISVSGRLVGELRMISGDPSLSVC